MTVRTSTSGTWKATPGAVYASVWWLATRLCVGVLVGATIAPDEQASTKQLWLLIATFGAYSLYLITVRPFIVPLANVFEVLTSLAQCAPP